MTEQNFAAQLSQDLGNLESQTYLTPPATSSGSMPVTTPNEQQIQGPAENAPKNDEVGPDIMTPHLSQDPTFDLSSCNYFADMDFGGFGSFVDGFGPADSWGFFDQTHYPSPPATGTGPGPAATGQMVENYTAVNENDAHPDNNTTAPPHLDQAVDSSNDPQTTAFFPPPTSSTSNFHDMALELGEDVNDAGFGADFLNYDW